MCMCVYIYIYIYIFMYTHINMGPQARLIGLYLYAHGVLPRDTFVERNALALKGHKITCYTATTTTTTTTTTCNNDNNNNDHNTHNDDNRPVRGTDLSDGDRGRARRHGWLPLHR